jgi:acetylornithine/succinyldiaminopimelate/putrescine aminotransferase
MNANEIIEVENKHTSGVYAKQTLTIVRGQGASLYDANGVEYLDCSSGHGVANLGHAHPKVAEALYRQASTLITLFETYPNDQRAELMKRLTGLVDGLDRVFFCNWDRIRRGGIEVCSHFHWTKKYRRGNAGISWKNVWIALGYVQQEIS